jgi:eukaryotic-like serine/threonine-protein kinase
MARGTTTRLTTHPAIDTAPIWTPDGSRVIFASNRDGDVTNIYWQAADGTGTAERLTRSPNTQQPYAVTPDGQTLIYPEFVGGQFDVFTMAITGDRTARALLTSPFNERRPAISPDGRWIAYQSDEVGRYEIVVPLIRRSIASAIWYQLVAEIFYQQGSDLIRVKVTTTPKFSVGKPQVVGANTLSPDAAVGMSYAIAPDGQRFVVTKPAEDRKASLTYRVVLNWFEDVKARTRGPE